MSDAKIVGALIQAVARCDAMRAWNRDEPHTKLVRVVRPFGAPSRGYFLGSELLVRVEPVALTAGVAAEISDEFAEVYDWLAREPVT